MFLFNFSLSQNGTEYIQCNNTQIASQSLGILSLEKHKKYWRNQGKIREFRQRQNVRTMCVSHHLEVIRTD